MNTKVPFAIDHFTICTRHRNLPIELMRGLGFVTADSYDDRSVHFIFDNTYLEFSTATPGTEIRWLTNSVPATNLPKVGSIRLSVRGTDPHPAHDALLAAQLENIEIGEINHPTTQPVHYGKRKGNASYQTFFIKNYFPFTDILFGATTQLNKDLIVKNPTKFQHVNESTRIAYLTAYADSPEKYEKAVENVGKLYEAIRDTTDIGYNLDTLQIVDHDGYVEEFGVEPRDDGLEFPIVAIGFTGAYLDYLEKQAYDLNLQYFRKNGKLYVDVRRQIGQFLVFEGEDSQA